MLQVAAHEQVVGRLAVTVVVVVRVSDCVVTQLRGRRGERVPRPAHVDVTVAELRQVRGAPVVRVLGHVGREEVWRGAGWRHESGSCGLNSGCGGKENNRTISQLQHNLNQDETNYINTNDEERMELKSRD